VQKAVEASPKNRFSWHVWALFEANEGNIDRARKLLKIGHAVNPRDPVILQSLALLEYNYSTPNIARVLFRKASQIDPRHQPVWIVRIICAYLFLLDHINSMLYSLKF
jgi:Tfp pilus assembly protein PilF